MNKIDKNINSLKIAFILLLIILPWLGLQSNSTLDAAIPSQEDLTFYEINPCRVSLFEFLRVNINTFYQDHYSFRLIPNTPISCFGLVSGVTLIGNEFYISIGSNPLINLIIQASFWTILISFIRKDSDTNSISKFPHYLSLVLTVLFFGFTIYAEERFYQNNFYLFDPKDKRYLLILLFISFFVTKNLIDVCLPRLKNLIYFIPGLYFFIGALNGFNFHFFALLFLYFGVLSFFKKGNLKNINIYILITSFFWVMNSAFTGQGYYFEPGKLRGFTSSVYSFYATLSWTVFFILLIKGLLFLYKNYLKNFELEKFTSVFAMSSIPILFAGLIGANFPIINLFNFFYFGQQKHGVTIKNPFLFNEWSEKIAWRGFYPSAETIGEYFGLIVIFLYFLYRKNSEISNINLFAGLIAVLGLYFSNNRAAFLFVVFVFVYFTTSKLNNKVRTISFALVSLLFLYIVGFQNLGYDYSFTSNVLFRQANNYQFDSIQSSFLELLNINQQNDNFFINIFKFISAGAFLLNRAELWGIFSSRYNPTFVELLFGTGPLNFGQLYGEVLIQPTKGVLLPHSSLLSFILFFGIVGVLLIILKMIIRIVNNKNFISAPSYLLLIYLLINIVKNDSLNYFPTFILYSLLFYIILNLNNRRVFK